MNNEKETNQEPLENAQETPETTPETAEASEAGEASEATAQPSEVEQLQQTIREKDDQYLRLLAEYDNYRKRSQKEKENAWASAKADTIKELLPVYDNLERALKQETCDEAYAKGVEMTMNQLKSVLEKLGVEEIPAQGQPFDPNVHNAVMHMEDEAFGENMVAEVFQAGFKLGEKVIRHALVKVAN